MANAGYYLGKQGNPIEKPLNNEIGESVRLLATEAEPDNCYGSTRPHDEADKQEVAGLQKVIQGPADPAPD